MIIIPCKFDNDHPFIYQCVDNIRKSNPKEKILIIDSDSEDKSYFSLNQDSQIEVLDFHNKNYGTNAYWIGYDMYPSEDYYFCIYDSLMIYDNLDDLKDYHLTAFRWFAQPPNIWDQDEDGTSMSKWGHQQLEDKCNLINPPTDFKGIFGPMFIADNTAMARLKRARVDQIYPTRKLELCSMERIYGIVAANLGFDFWTHAIQGEMHGFWDTYPNQRVEKINVGRL